MRALLRRSRRRPGMGKLRVGPLEIDSVARQVWLRGEPVELSKKEFALLRALAAEPTRVFTREELLRGVWGFRAMGQTRTLDSHAFRLRRKLNSSGDRFVVNVWGVGYRLRRRGDRMSRTAADGLSRASRCSRAWPPGARARRAWRLWPGRVTSCAVRWPPPGSVSSSASASDSFRRRSCARLTWSSGARRSRSTTCAVAGLGARDGRMRQEVDVAELLTDSVEAWRAPAAARGVALALEWSGRPARVWGERLRLAQATGNLIANAIEHGGGAISVRGSLAPEHHRVRIEVVDAGPGLPAPVADLARRPRGGRGARGRGLAIAATIAHDHGGRLAAAPVRAARGSCSSCPPSPDFSI